MNHLTAALSNEPIIPDPHKLKKGVEVMEVVDWAVKSQNSAAYLCAAAESTRNTFFVSLAASLRPRPSPSLLLASWAKSFALSQLPVTRETNPLIVAKLPTSLTTSLDPANSSDPNIRDFTLWLAGNCTDVGLLQLIHGMKVLFPHSALLPVACACRAITLFTWHDVGPLLDSTTAILFSQTADEGDTGVTEPFEIAVVLGLISKMIWSTIGLR